MFISSTKTGGPLIFHLRFCAAARVERTRIGEFFASKVPSLREFARDGKDGMTGEDAVAGIREAMRALQG